MWTGAGLFWVLLLGVIVWLVVQLVSSRQRPDVPPGPTGASPGAPAPESPLAVLDRRLAAGEVDIETYQQVRAALLEPRGGRP
jgi:putative membrane protein